MSFLLKSKKGDKQFIYRMQLCENLVSITGLQGETEWSLVFDKVFHAYRFYTEMLNEINNGTQNCMVEDVIQKIDNRGIAKVVHTTAVKHFSDDVKDMIRKADLTKGVYINVNGFTVLADSYRAEIVDSMYVVKMDYLVADLKCKLRNPTEDDLFELETYLTYLYDRDYRNKKVINLGEMVQDFSKKKGKAVEVTFK